MWWESALWLWNSSIWDGLAWWMHACAWMMVLQMIILFRNRFVIEINNTRMVYFLMVNRSKESEYLISQFKHIVANYPWTDSSKNEINNKSTIQSYCHLSSSPFSFSSSSSSASSPVLALRTSESDKKSVVERDLSTLGKKDFETRRNEEEDVSIEPESSRT